MPDGGAGTERRLREGRTVPLAESRSGFPAHPGLKIVYPATASDAKGLLKSAIRDEDCVLYFEHKYLYRRIKEEMPAGDHLTPIGKARIAREGKDVSIITYAATVWKALEAAEQVQKRTDCCRSRRSAHAVAHGRRSDRCHREEDQSCSHRARGHPHGWSGGRDHGQINESAFEWLDAPILRVTAADVPLPYSPPLGDTCCRRRPTS